MCSAIGVPVVTPSNTPDRIFTVSGSWRCVTKRDCPGRRLSSQVWISLSCRAMRGGTPSTTQPIAGPWLSPQLVNRKRVPKLLPAMPASALLALEIAEQFGDLLGRRGLDHADDVVAAIDMHDFTSHAGAEVRQQVESGIADFLLRDVALERRIELVPLQYVAPVGDAGEGKGFDRSG